jgi:ribonucleoside-diphosphate reductase alpha chain
MTDKQYVKEAAVEYFKDEITANVWYDKYCLKKGGVPIELSPEDTISRLAREIHRIESNYPHARSYKDIYSLMAGYGKFVLAGSPLFGIGNTETLSTLGNCFVVDSPVDSYGGIFRTDQELAQIMKRRGGVGVDLSSLRPKRSPVNNAAATSTGAVSFMDRYSNTTREVAQEGRRGALMLTMNVDHPDIEQFVVAKDDLRKVTGANISVKVTDDFMNAVMRDEMHDLVFNNVKYGEIRAQLLWRKLIHQAWKNAEPGLLFWDRIIENSPADCYFDFQTITTNPCSELPLCAYDSCRIASINVFKYVKEPLTPQADFDFNQLFEDSMLAQRIMDDVIDLEAEKILGIMDKIVKDPESPDIKQVELDLWQKILHKLMLGRRTGLGQMGVADAGIALGYKYASPEFNDWAEKVAQEIASGSYSSSMVMARERGAFPAFNRDLEQSNPYIKRVLEWVDMKYATDYFAYGRRNIANLTIAPTGSISMLAGVSSGIEPPFALSYTRKRKVTEDHPTKTYKDEVGNWWEIYDVVHPGYKKAEGTRFAQIYEDSVAHKIKSEDKLRLQAQVQPWVDHSISVTYNLPSTATEAEVSELYFNAWGLGLKGLTIYRDGSREGVLTIGKKEKEVFAQNNSPKRPRSLACNIHHVKSKGLDWTVCVGMLGDKPYEVFAMQKAVNKTKETGEIVKQTKGRYDLKIDGDGVLENMTEGCPAEENLLTRMISTSLRHGADMKFIVEQLDKSTGDITSFGKAIARTLRKYLPAEMKVSGQCPECGSTLIYHGGCAQCNECGWGKCN